jgi:hypothetical protein
MDENTKKNIGLVVVTTQPDSRVVYIGIKVKLFQRAGPDPAGKEGALNVNVLFSV